MLTNRSSRACLRTLSSVTLWDIELTRQVLFLDSRNRDPNQGSSCTKLLVLSNNLNHNIKKQKNWGLVLYFYHQVLFWGGVTFHFLATPLHSLCPLLFVLPHSVFHHSHLLHFPILASALSIPLPNLPPPTLIVNTYLIPL